MISCSFPSPDYSICFLNELEFLKDQYKIINTTNNLNYDILLNKNLNIGATYHDPCYLGRYNGIYDDPREVMKLCGVELVEMPRNKENSFCCGAGGGQIWLQDHDDMTQRPSENRIEEAVSVGVNNFTVACPKDMTMYSDAAKTSGNENNMAVKDIIDFVLEAMELPAAEPSETQTE